MDPNPRLSRPLGARVAVLIVVSTLVPALAILGLGAWYISQVKAAAEGTTLQESTLWIVALVAAVVVVLVVVFASMRIRALMRSRVLALTEVCRQFSVGNRGARAPSAGRDEFALLGATINAMLDGAPVLSANRGVSPEFQDATVLQAQIEKLLQEVSSVGDGDLRVQAEVTPDTLGVLADSFNYMIEELAKVVGRVQATALQVTNATRRLLDRSAEVAQSSEGQALQISQTSESVARLADFVQLSATNALRAAEAAKGAIQNAHAGQKAVVQTIDGMVQIRENVQETSKKIKRLGERSQEVGEIVRLIEEIADQTNLLALNAAIQSAMAGEHGRGFAVVADEIRALAERVTDATKRISTIVKSIQGDTYEAVVAMEDSTQQVVNGSRLADEAGKALQSIYTAVEQQARMIEDIARAAGDRKQTAEAVAAAMGQIAEITRQTNSATQDTTTSVSYLAELAEQLRASVATFRLPEQIAEAAGLLAQQAEQPYLPSDMQLPRLGEGDWGDGMALLPALPAASAMPQSSMPLGAAGEYNYGEYSGYNGYGAAPQGYGQAPPPDYAPDYGADYGQAPPPDYGANYGQGPQPDYGADYGQGQMPEYGQMPGYGQAPWPSNGRPSQYGPPAQQEYPDPPFPSGPLGEPPF